MSSVGCGIGHGILVRDDVVGSDTLKAVVAISIIHCPISLYSIADFFPFFPYQS